MPGDLGLGTRWRPEAEAGARTPPLVPFTFGALAACGGNLKIRIKARLNPLLFKWSNGYHFEQPGPAPGGCVRRSENTQGPMTDK